MSDDVLFFRALGVPGLIMLRLSTALQTNLLDCYERKKEGRGRKDERKGRKQEEEREEEEEEREGERKEKELKRKHHEKNKEQPSKSFGKLKVSKD